MKMFKQPAIKNQSGIVSLIIVSILAIVLGLIAIGFSQLTNRELRQASDRELDAQAFYSAESGINDAIAYLEDSNAQFPLNGCTDWQSTTVGPKYFANDLSSPNNPAGNAKYTCVIIDNKVPNLVYQLNAGQSVTVKISQPAMAKLFLGWENQGPLNAPLSATLGNLPQESSLTPSQTGVLKTSMYGVSPACAGQGNDCLANLSRNYFMYPSAAGTNSVIFSSGAYSKLTGPSNPNGEFVSGNCKAGNTDPNTGATSTGRYCKSSVTGLNGPAPTYYLQLTALYTNLNVTLWGQDSGGNAITFTGTQGLVDVTGKGADVLQRIRARVDIGRDYLDPAYALQSMEAICKGFTVDVPSAGTYGSTIDNSSMPNPDGSCAQPADSGGTAPGNGGDLSPH